MSEIFLVLLFAVVCFYCCSWYSITSLESVLNPTANDNDDDDAIIVITTIRTIISPALKHSFVLLVLLLSGSTVNKTGSAE